MNAEATLHRKLRLAGIHADVGGLVYDGFRAALRRLVAEFNPKIRKRSDLDNIFGEWFGDCNVVPAAHRIRRDGPGVWGVTVEVYEVENSIELPAWKLAQYGRMADGEGPHFELHILDKWDREICITSDHLMVFSTLGCEHFTERDVREYMKPFRGEGIAVRYHVTIDRREIERLRDELSKAKHGSISEALQNIIWGLGRNLPHAEIADKCSVTVENVRTLSMLLAEGNISPKSLLNARQAKWKVAHDALRELGINV